MAIEFRPLSRILGAEVIGVDLAAAAAKDHVDQLRAAWLEYGVLLFRKQSLPGSVHVEATRLFGDPVVYTRSENADPANPELNVLSNAYENGRRLGAAISGRYWHTDGHWCIEPPAGSLLWAKVVPPTGGDTWFANMTAAYAALPDATKARIDGLRILISRVQSLPYHYPERPPAPANQREIWPDTPHPLVRTHPVTGRKALYFGGIVPWRVVGMPEEESKPLLEELQAFAFSPRFTFSHQWQAGDALLWDNRSCSHRATEYEMGRYERTMVRTTIAGDVPV